MAIATFPIGIYLKTGNRKGKSTRNMQKLGTADIDLTLNPDTLKLEIKSFNRDLAKAFREAADQLDANHG